MDKIDLTERIKNTSRPPINIQHWQRIYINKIAIRGSSPLPYPLPKQFKKGYTWSLANAWRTRAPPIKEPKAAEKPTIEIPIKAI